MSDTLRLARSLGALGDDALAALLQTREVAGAPPRDLFDLADALLEPESITRALRPFDRATIEWLAAGAATPPPPSAPVAELTALGLVARPSEAAPHTPPHAYTAVREVASRVLASAPGDATLAAAADARKAPDAATAHAEETDAHGSAVGTTGRASSPDAATGDAEGTDAGGGTTASVDLAAGERAFGALVAVSELGHQARVAALRMKARGGVPVAEEKRLAPLLAVDPEDVGIVVHLAQAAGLLGEDGDRLLSTTALDDWHRLAPERRWLRLVSAWIATLPRPVRRTLESVAPVWPGPHAAASAFRALHPAADDAMVEALGEVDRVAAFLGLVVGEESSAFGAAALAPSDSVESVSTAEEAAAAAIAPLFPPEVDRVYVQHDLSVIAPGPLAPPLDARLRRLASLENRGVASSYRITAQSIDRALAEGETAAGAREFLASLSLTGIPQSLDYLLTQGERRHGMLRVLPASPSAAQMTAEALPARTLIRTADPALADSLAVDQSLAVLALRRTPDGDLTSRAAPATVFWALTDARYPALVENENGERLLLHRVPVLPARPHPGSGARTETAGTTADKAAPRSTAPNGAPPHRGAPNGADTTSPHDTAPRGTAPRGTAPDGAPPRSTTPPPPASILDLVRRLRAAPASAIDDDTAWMVRQIDQAIRSRSPLLIEVRFPDDSVRAVEVTPLSVANGRLRCLDLRAGVERTVPVANIVALTPVSPGADVD